MIPSDWTAAYRQGLDAVRDQEYAHARERFSHAIEAGADQWEPFYARAWTIVKIGDGDLDVARRDLERASGEMGGGTDVTALLGCVYERLGEHERAVPVLLTAYGRSSIQDAVEETLASSLSQLLDTVERRSDTAAVAICDRLLETLDATALAGGVSRQLRAEVLVSRAFVHDKLGHADLAQEDLRQVTAIVPQHPRLPARNPAGSPTGAASSAPAAMEGNDPTFEGVGGIDDDSTFVGRLRRRVFDMYFTDPDVQTLNERLAVYGGSPTRSILLFGPSGCGKTYVIRAFSGEYRRRHGRDLPIFRLRLNDVLNRYVGDDEKRMTEIFDQAADNQPSILFADEIDSLGMSREGGQDWRVQLTAHFLQEIDRLKEQRAAVIFFGCTNMIWSVDMALLRRFDEVLPVELPDEETRAKIFQIYLDALAPAVRDPDIDVASLALKSHGLTPGDIQKVVSAATVSAVTEGRDGTRDGRLGNAQLVASLDSYQQPMHVSQWVRQSLTALRKIGQESMAQDVERSYGSFVEGGVEAVTTFADGTPWQPVPVQAWADEPAMDLNLLRRLRR